MKTCTKCKVAQSLDRFGRNARRPDGLQAWCRGCKSVDNAKYSAANKAKISAQQKKYRADNILATKARHLKYYTRNKDRLDQYAAEWREKNRERWASYTSSWRRENPALSRAQGARYRASRARTKPFDREFFNLVELEAYDVAVRREAATGIPWHVDHIVPLQSDIVCGLHNEYNLAVITAHENVKKGNRVWPDMPLPESPRRRRETLRRVANVPVNQRIQLIATVSVLACVFDGI